VTLTFVVEQDRVKVNHPTTYLGQRSFRSVIVRTRSEASAVRAAAGKNLGKSITNSVQFIVNWSLIETRMWANAQRDGRPAEYRWCPLFNAAKFG